MDILKGREGISGGGGSLSPGSWVTASLPNSDSRSITGDALGLEVVMATKLSEY